MQLLIHYFYHNQCHCWSECVFHYLPQRFLLIFLPEWQNGGGSIVRVWKPRLSLNFVNSCMLNIEYITWSRGFNRIFADWGDGMGEGPPLPSAEKWPNSLPLHPSPIPSVNHSTKLFHHHHQWYFYPLIICITELVINLTFPNSLTDVLYYYQILLSLIIQYSLFT